MSAILIATASIFAIAGLVWLANKLLRTPACPICLGVGGTWLWMVIARALGYPVDAAVLSILLGGSVAGIAYLVEKRLPRGRSPLAWKTLFIPGGFIAAYALVSSQWMLFGAAAGALALLAAYFLYRPGAQVEQSETVEALKRKMQQCC